MQSHLGVQPAAVSKAKVVGGHGCVVLWCVRVTAVACRLVPDLQLTAVTVKPDALIPKVAVQR